MIAGTREEKRARSVGAGASNATLSDAPLSGK
jgi:hypothetical protein